ncbi:MAG: hypothetical protein SF162_01020 [bacterium]|nr:hypothetical protein [bacterium]
MNQQSRPIYVAEEISEEVEGLRIVRWDQHPALLPLGLVRHIVSTDAGDVELHMPFVPTMERQRLYAAFDQVSRLHPKPTDLEALEVMSRDQLLTLALRFALEYVGLAEDGRGHNDRSRYLARCLRRIDSLTYQNVVCPTATLDESDAVVSTGDLS